MKGRTTVFAMIVPMACLTFNVRLAVAGPTTAPASAPAAARGPVGPVSPYGQYSDGTYTNTAFADLTVKLPQRPWIDRDEEFIFFWPDPNHPPDFYTVDGTKIGPEKKVDPRQIGDCVLLNARYPSRDTGLWRLIISARFCPKPMSMEQAIQRSEADNASGAARTRAITAGAFGVSAEEINGQRYEIRGSTARYLDYELWVRTFYIRSGCHVLAFSWYYPSNDYTPTIYNLMRGVTVRTYPQRGLEPATPEEAAEEAKNLKEQVQKLLSGARAHVDAREYTSAQRTLATLKELVPENTEAAQIEAKLGEPLRKAAAAVQAGQELLQHGQRDSATAKAQEALGICPDHAGAAQLKKEAAEASALVGRQMELAQSLQAKNDLAKAIAALERLDAPSLSHAPAMELLKRLRSAQEELNRTSRLREGVATLQKQVAAARLSLSEVLKSGSVQDSQATLEKTRKMETEAEDLLVQGNLPLGREKLEGALASYKAAMTSLLDMRVDQARKDVAAGRNGPALKNLREVLAKDDTHAGAAALKRQLEQLTPEWWLKVGAGGVKNGWQACEIMARYARMNARLGMTESYKGNIEKAEGLISSSGVQNWNRWTCLAYMAGAYAAAGARDKYEAVLDTISKEAKRPVNPGCPTPGGQDWVVVFALMMADELPRADQYINALDGASSRATCQARMAAALGWRDAAAARAYLEAAQSALEDTSGSSPDRIADQAAVLVEIVRAYEELGDYDKADASRSRALRQIQAMGKHPWAEYLQNRVKGKSLLREARAGAYDKARQKAMIAIGEERVRLLTDICTIQARKLNTDGVAEILKQLPNPEDKYNLSLNIAEMLWKAQQQPNTAASTTLPAQPPAATSVQSAGKSDAKPSPQPSVSTHKPTEPQEGSRIAGRWNGMLVRTSDGARFLFSMSLEQKGDTITGTSTIADPRNKAVMQLTGSQSGNTLDFEESKVVGERSDVEFFSTLKKGALTWLAGPPEQLLGTWSGGEIAIARQRGK